MTSEPFFLPTETDEQNILTVYLAKPISGSNKEGSMVKIYFDSLYDIQMIVKKLFGEEKHMASWFFNTGPFLNRIWGDN